MHRCGRRWVRPRSSAGCRWARTVDDLRQALTVEYPQLPAAAGAIYAAINRAYAGDSTVLRDGDEVAFFPPVSGGQDAAKKLFEITTAPAVVG